MATKYIVNNVTGQTITDLNVSGNFSINDIKSSDLATYKALLTETEPITGTSIFNFNGAFIIGGLYTIDNYVINDDFSNIATVISGNINETGCQFIATGETPSNWSNSSQLISNGGLVVNVMENNLGYELEWNTFIGSGTYLAFPSIYGTKYNNFPRTKTSVISQEPIYPISPYLKYLCSPVSVSSKDDAIAFGVLDTDLGTGVSNMLYNSPVEIKMKLDTDTTPVIISGSVISIYPFSFASVDLYCDGNYVEGYFGENVTVNNLTELITELNTNEQTSYLGTYSEDGSGGLLLTIPTNLVNRFCSNGTLTFEVYAD